MNFDAIYPGMLDSSKEYFTKDGYHIEYKDFDEAELNYLGPLVTKEVCERYNLKSVKQYKELNKGLKFTCDEKEQNLYEAQHFNRKHGKLKRLIIASGDRDAMNIASCGEAVIWFNSETQVKSPQVIGMLKKYATEILKKIKLGQKNILTIIKVFKE